MYLTEVSLNERVRVLSVEGYGLSQTLALRGVGSGRIITKISGFFGPVVILTGHGTLVIGKGMARKIIVEKVNPCS